MKAFLLVIALFCVGCVSRKTPEFIPNCSRKVAIKLSDSLGTITMYVPERYDTGFAWLHQSDCEPCHEMKYRFQSKRFKIQMENGYFWKRPTDSIDQLTIIYFPYDNPPPRGIKRINNTQMYENKSFNASRREDMKHWPREKYLMLDTCFLIHDRPLYAWGTREYDVEKKQYMYLLTAETYVWSRVIKFEFKLMTDRQDSISIHFIKDAAESIQTIQLSNPPSFGR